MCWTGVQSSQGHGHEKEHERRRTDSSEEATEAEGCVCVCVGGGGALCATGVDSRGRSRRRFQRSVRKRSTCDYVSTPCPPLLVQERSSELSHRGMLPARFASESASPGLTWLIINLKEEGPVIHEPHGRESYPVLSLVTRPVPLSGVCLVVRIWSPEYPCFPSALMAQVQTQLLESVATAIYPTVWGSIPTPGPVGRDASGARHSCSRSRSAVLT